MALKIFQGKTEAEAVEAAAQELGISRGNLKYEVIGTKKKGLFSKGEVRIGIEMGGENSEPVYDDEQEEEGLPVSEEIVAKVIDFVSGMIDKMELAGQVKLTSSANNKICLSIESEDSRILIGKKGKTLDALQVLANSIAQNLSQDGVRTIIDCENYRMRRQEKILDFAEQVADRAVMLFRLQLRAAGGGPQHPGGAPGGGAGPLACRNPAAGHIRRGGERV